MYRKTFSFGRAGVTPRKCPFTPSVSRLKCSIAGCPSDFARPLGIGSEPSTQTLDDVERLQQQQLRRSVLSSRGDYSSVDLRVESIVGTTEQLDNRVDWKQLKLTSRYHNAFRA
jgi:hypothetical protein